eukprot:9175728-Pyramimonas_sp.AAC.1
MGGGVCTNVRWGCTGQGQVSTVRFTISVSSPAVGFPASDWSVVRIYPRFLRLIGLRLGLSGGAERDGARRLAEPRVPPAQPNAGSVPCRDWFTPRAYALLLAVIGSHPGHMLCSLL